jgi:hypothetical protein
MKRVLWLMSVLVAGLVGGCRSREPLESDSGDADSVGVSDGVRNSDSVGDTAGSSVDGPGGLGACRIDEDCRLFDDYCTGCQCLALRTSDPNPKCAGPGVKCVQAPCANKMAACQSFRCAVVAGGGAAQRWFHTCGDPVCGGWRAKPGIPLCNGEKVGSACKPLGASCDPHDDCNRLLSCATTDPTTSAGGCPKSRRELKRDIRYLSAEELRRYERELVELKLATWRYKQDPARERLGFIIDDHETSVAVDGSRDMVDLYGYTSLAVAALQVQARELETMRRELSALRKELAALKARPPRAFLSPPPGR